MDRARASRPAVFWATVGQLNLELFYKVIGSNTTVGWRPTYSPHLLIKAWLNAISKGIGSSREIDRRCDYDPAFQWLTWMEAISYRQKNRFPINMFMYDAE